jgi:23S rRNA (cytidine1920-2'-O)/16S rRNA (cytidine1409-2'-O)-methyltransferase
VQQTNIYAIDQLLVQRQLASTRSQAQRLIAGGVQWHNGEARGGASSRTVMTCQPMRNSSCWTTSEARYVSRGGLKLEAALTHVGLKPAGWQCLDVGQSTGGFTDCLLQHGAAWWWVSTWAVPNCTRACAQTHVCCVSSVSTPAHSDAF